MIYEIVTVPKSDIATEEALRAALAEHKVGFAVENIKSDDSLWTVRLAADDDKPDFLKKKDEAPDESADSAEDATDDSADEAEEGEDGEKSDKGEGEKGDKKGDPVKEVKTVIDQLTQLFTDLGGKVEELQSAHDEKAQKLKDIGDTVGGEGGPGGLEGGPEGVEGMPPAGGLPEDVGPTPGKPAGPPRPPMPSKGLDRRKPGLPAGLPAFTNYQVATHPGVDDKGEKISLTAAAVEMEADPEFSNYEVVGMTENADGTFSAKLKLRS